MPIYAQRTATHTVTGNDWECEARFYCNTTYRTKSIASNGSRSAVKVRGRHNLTSDRVQVTCIAPLFFLRTDHE
jgi:hypothetical protein